MELTLESVSFSYPKAVNKVLTDVSFRVASEAVVALVGPSGCGKSTTLRLIAGLEQLSAGSISAGGSVDGLTESVLWHPDGNSLIPSKRAFENATLAATISGQSKSEVEAKADRLFHEFGLTDAKRKWPHELSAGMAQRVGLLRSVCSQRPILAMDEPFSALDAITAVELQRWFIDLLEVEPRTIVFVTHNLAEAVRLADRVVVMSQTGTVVDNIEVPTPRQSDAAVNESLAKRVRALVEDPRLLG